MNNALKTIFESAEALNENGLQVLALIAGVIRQVAPSPETRSVAEPLPETSPVAPVAVSEAKPEPPVEPSQAVESVAEPLPEAAPVEPSQAQEPAYRFILNVPEIKDYKDAK